MRTRAPWLLSLLGLWVVLVGWAMASPVGSAPDDDFHLASIWCAGGEQAGVCEAVEGQPEVRAVPIEIANTSECYRFDREVSAACADAFVADSANPAGELVGTLRVNEVLLLYPNGYYSAMHFFVGPDEVRSVMVMRIVNATLAVAALAWVIALATSARVRSGSGIARLVAVATAVVWIPLGLSILGSTNPSSWSFTGLMLLTAMGLVLLRGGENCAPLAMGSRSWWFAALGVFVGALMATASRLDAAAYIAIVVVVLFVLTVWRGMRQAWQSSALLLAVAIWGALTFALAPTPGGGPGGTMGQAEQGIGLLLTNLTFVGVYTQGVVGGWPLSWSDVQLPPSIPIIGTLVLGAVIAFGMRVMWQRKGWALGVSAAALITVPLVFLQREGLGVGEVVQPRYIAPLLLLVVMIALVDRAGDPVTLPTGVRWSITIGLALSASLSWWVFAHRFAYGSGVGVFDAEAIAPYAAAWLLVSVAGALWIWWALRDQASPAAVSVHAQRMGTP